MVGKPGICELSRCHVFGKLEQRQGWVAPVLVILRPEHVSCCRERPFDCTARTEYTLGDDGSVMVAFAGEPGRALDPGAEETETLRVRLHHLLTVLAPRDPEDAELIALKYLRDDDATEADKLAVARHLGLTPEEVL